MDSGLSTATCISWNHRTSLRNISTRNSRTVCSCQLGQPGARVVDCPAYWRRPDVCLDGLPAFRLELPERLEQPAQDCAAQHCGADFHGRGASLWLHRRRFSARRCCSSQAGQACRCRCGYLASTPMRPWPRHLPGALSWSAWQGDTQAGTPSYRRGCYATHPRTVCCFVLPYSQS